MLSEHENKPIRRYAAFRIECLSNGPVELSVTPVCRAERAGVARCVHFQYQMKMQTSSPATNSQHS